MKNFLKVFALMLFLSGTSYLTAQIAIGPKVGVNIASVGGDDASDDAQSVLGFQFGATAEIGINDMFAVQPELLFFQKGSQLDGNPEDFKTILNYLEVPVLAKVKFGAAEGTQFFATVGPSFGFGLGGKVKAGDNEMDIDFDDFGISKFDLGLSVGAGAQFPAGPGDLFLDVRYLLGLTTTDDSGNADVFNRGLGVAAGFLFPIGGGE